MRLRTFTLLFAVAFLLVMSTVVTSGERTKLMITSTIDKTEQPSYLMLPKGFAKTDAPRPLLVNLHSWSRNNEHVSKELEAAAEKEGWIVVCPNFRGANNHPEACGSLLAQKDIIDAVDYVQANYPIDAKRIYLTGNSGGGHMTMLMVGTHPDVWAAASAWVGISDLTAWHKRHAKGNYGAMIRASCGGPPGASKEIDEQYRLRSPLTHLARASATPIDISAGIQDGHAGSVPIAHTLNAFNEIAKAAGDPPVSPAEIAQLSKKNGRLAKPMPSDQVTDDTFGRAIYLRRHAGKARVTIFEGGHEGIVSATIAWLKQHAKE